MARQLEVYNIDRISSITSSNIYYNEKTGYILSANIYGGPAYSAADNNRLGLKVVFGFSHYFEDAENKNFDQVVEVKNITSTVFWGLGYETVNFNINDNVYLSNPGKFYCIGAYIYDRYGEYLTSPIYYDSTVYMVPKTFSDYSILDIVNDYSGIVNVDLGTNKLDRSIFIRWDDPNFGMGVPLIKQSNIIFQQSSDSKIWNNIVEIKESETYDDDESSSSLDPDKITRAYYNFSPGYYYRFGIRMVDELGRIVDFMKTDSSSIFYRDYGPELGNSTFSITGPEEDGFVTIRPYSISQNIVFSSIKAISDNSYGYYIEAYIEDKNLLIPILTNVQPNNESGDTVYFTLTPQQIQEKFFIDELKDKNSDLSWNINYSKVTYRIYVKDVTGLSSSTNVTTNTQLKFIEAPYFNAGEYITLGIQYGDNTILNINNINLPNISTTDEESIANERMINPGEAIYFNFNKANDYNNDIVEYQLYVNRLDTKPSVSFDSNYTNGNFEFLNSYSIEELNIENNLISFIYPINIYSINKFLIFSIVAIDSKGNTSERKYSQTYLIGCRVQSASISIRNLEIDNSNKLQCSYIISDLGGSSFVDKQYTYTQYPNFEREISLNSINYSKKARILLEYCIDGNFSNQTTDNYGSNYIEYGINNNFENDIYNNGEISTISSNILNNNFLNKRLYARITLIMSIGPGQSEILNFENVNINISYSAPSTYYFNMPTLSHRSHHIGINTNLFSDEEDEILVISDFQNRNKIKITGITIDGDVINLVLNIKNGTITGYDNNNINTITINFKDKIIDGATISGGNW